MPRPDDEPQVGYGEVLTPTPARDARELIALLKRYGPSIEKFVAMIESGMYAPQRGGKTGLADYFGQALVSGRFDGLIEELRGAVAKRVNLPPGTGTTGPRRRR